MNLFSTKKGTRFLLATILSFAALFSGQSMNAQVAFYTFSQSSGTYAPIVGGTVVDSATYGTTANTLDSKNWSISLPFSFVFNGTSYSTINANSNGYITFGTTTPGTSTTTPISTTTAYDGAISAMARDLWGVFVSQGTVTLGSNVITGVTDFTGLNVGTTMSNTSGIPTGTTVTAFDVALGTITLSTNATASSTNSGIRWGTGLVKTAVEGSAPNRIFVIEYSGFGDYTTTANTRSVINFQIRLSETSNVINVVYGTVSQNVTTSRTNQVGLRGAANTDFNNRTSTTSWSATTAGTSSSSTVTRTNLINPNSGLTFTWTPASCLPPTNPVVTSFTTNSAVVSWIASGSAPANGYEYYVSTSSTAPTSSTVATGSVVAGVTTVSLSSLTANTNYYVWVRALCSANDISAWTSTSANIYTGFCIPSSTSTATYIDSFSTSGGTTDIAKYATGYTIGGYANYTTTDSVVSFAGGQFAFTTVFVGGTLGSAIWVDWNNNLVFETTERVFNTTSYTASGATVITGTVSVPAGTSMGSYRMRVLVHYNSSNPTDPCASNSRLEVEDYTLNVGAPPACLPVTVLSSSAITNSTATIYWTAPSPAPSNGYDYYYSTTNTAPTSATTPSGSVAAGVTSASLASLTGSTTYYYWVRANCGTSTSDWSATTMSFTTECDPVSVPFVESFSSGSLPACWSNSNPSSTSSNALWKFSGTPGYGTTSNGKATGTYAWVDASSPYATLHYVTLTSPIINASTVTNPYLEFEWFKNNDDLSYDNNKLTVQANNGSGWVTVWSDTSNSLAWRQVAFSLGSTYAVSNLQLRFVVDKDVAGNGYFYDDLLLDEVKVGETPSCFPPTNLSVSNITGTGATISWNAPSVTPANGYEYYYSTSATAPTSGTSATGSVATGTSVGLSGLSNNTTYHVWVRSACGSNDKSIWTLVNLSFTTNQIPATLPYSESFSSGANWTMVNATINKWFVGSATGNPANSLYISNDSGVSNAYTITTTNISHAYRDITLSSPANSFLFKFDWKMIGEGSSTKYDYFRVWVVPTSFVPTAGTQISTASGGMQIGGSFNDPSATTAIWHNESFQIPTTYAGQTVRLVFEWRNDGSGGTQPPAAIDNFFIDACNNTVALGNDTTICIGNTVALNAGNAGSTYLWSNAATTQSINVSTAGTYHVAVTASNGCVARDTIVVTTNALPVVNLGNDTSICSGNTLALNAGNAGASYLWSNSATTQSINVTAAGTYWTKVTNASGCFAYDTVVVTVNAVPTVSLGNDTTFCAGNSLTLNAGNSGATYLWSTSATTQSITVSSSGTYWAKVTNTNGCFTYDTVVVTVNSVPTVALGSDTSFCAGDSVILSAGNAGMSYLWSTGDTTQSIYASASGTYWAKVTNANSCASTDTIVVTVNPLPLVDLGSDTAICANATTVISAGNTGSSYLWSTGDTTMSISVDTADVYWVTVTNANGCSATDTIEITELPLPLVDSIVATAVGGFTWTFSLAGANNWTTVTWDFGDGQTSNLSSPTHTYSTPGTYVVCATVSNNCGSVTICKTIVIPPVSVRDLQLSAKELFVYPNPTQHILTIKNESNYSMEKAEVFNLIGQKVMDVPVMNGKLHTIDVSKFASGMYHLRISFENEGVITRKFEVIK